MNLDERCQGESARRALVEYVRDADPQTMETSALEWKRNWDLTKAEVQFQVARQVLGFGNRLPAEAARTFGGYAYLLVGVQPGEVHGASIPDPADLTDAVRRFVLAGQPSWEPAFVRVDGAEVLVVEVAPPQDGDRICCLARGFDNVLAGRIFVRRPGQTAEADAAEVRGLEDRLLATTAEDARRAVRAHEDLAHATREQSAQLETRARQDGELRARGRAPRFVKSRRRPEFAFIEPNRMEGQLRNTGESEAIVRVARLHRDGPGAVPGGMRAIYPSNETSPILPAPVPHGIELGLVFDNPVLQGVQNEELTLVLEYDDDDGFAWSSALTLHRKGRDVQGHQVWIVGEVSSRML